MNPVPPRLRNNGDELDALLGRVAEALDRPFSFLEKDFWAMEVLRVASVDRPITYRGDSTGTVRTVFKGGTSLSRVYGLIDRFSEDIDLLVLFPNGDGGPGQSARDALLKRIAAEVLEHLDPKLVSGPERLDSTTGVKRKVKYHYPLRAVASTALTEGVILEMGSRGGPEPMERRSLRSIAADYAISELGESEDQWEEFAFFDVNVLGAERTLLEKLSAVHSITSDPPRSIESAPAGWGRHFYDIHQLLQSDEIRAKLADMGRDEVQRLVIDIEERSAAARWHYAERPVDGFASSPAFDATAPVADDVRRAYQAVAALMYDSIVPLEECLATVHNWAELL